MFIGLCVDSYLQLCTPAQVGRPKLHNLNEGGGVRLHPTKCMLRTFPETSGLFFTQAPSDEGPLPDAGPSAGAGEKGTMHRRSETEEFV